MSPYGAVGTELVVEISNGPLDKLDRTVRGGPLLHTTDQPGGKAASPVPRPNCITRS